MLYTEAFSPLHFEGSGAVRIRGEQVSWRSVSEDLVFYGDSGQAIASMFSISYFRTDADNVKARPVLFCFNGGPLASSMSLHAGILGPVRIRYPEDVNDPGTPLPPYHSMENEDSLLDEMDLVLIDPVGVGFSRLLDPEAKEKFYGIEQDAESFLVFIAKWLSRYNRWESPRYLLGESYGCTRAATIAGMGSVGGALQSFHVSFDGVIMVGNTVTGEKFFQDRRPVYPAVLALPTLAAINWYHRRPSGQPLDAFVAEASDWAETEYLTALFRGEDLSGEERRHVKERLIYYTGVSEEYAESRNLIAETVAFRKEPLREQGLVVSRYDARISRPIYSPAVTEPELNRSDDPMEGKYDPYLRAVMEDELFPRLGIRTERSFVCAMRFFPIWDTNIQGRTTAECLAASMRRVPGMRLLFMNGWYDLCTQTGLLKYTIRHSGFDRKRVFFRGYEAGHMVFLGEDNLKKACGDIRAFVGKQMK